MTIKIDDINYKHISEFPEKANTIVARLQRGRMTAGSAVDPKTGRRAVKLPKCGWYMETKEA